MISTKNIIKSARNCFCHVRILSGKLSYIKTSYWKELCLIVTWKIWLVSVHITMTRRCGLFLDLDLPTKGYHFSLKTKKRFNSARLDRDQQLHKLIDLKRKPSQISHPQVLGVISMRNLVQKTDSKNSCKLRNLN